MSAVENNESPAVTEVVVAEEPAAVANPSPPTPVPTKKAFVMTEKRKLNLAKANDARRKNQDHEKMLRDERDLTISQFNKFYDDKLSAFKNIEMGKKSAPETEPTPLVVESRVKPTETKEDSSDSESSDSEPEVLSKKEKKRQAAIAEERKRAKKVYKKKPKKVVYESSSSDESESEQEASSSEEEVAYRRHKRKDRKRSEGHREPPPPPHRPSMRPSWGGGQNFY